MALYAGEAVRIRVEANDPETGLPLDPRPDTAFVEFWGPGKNPVRDLDVRNDPDFGPYNLSYRGDEDDWIIYKETRDFDDSKWTAGNWFYRVTVIGAAYENWEYGRFRLRE